MRVICCGKILIFLLSFSLCNCEEKEESDKEKGQKTSDQDALLKRCYGEWGCFSIGEPFLSIYRPVNLFPMHPDILDVKFFLKTRDNPDVFKELKIVENASLPEKDFVATRPLKFIIHGYLEHGHQKWIQDLIRELLTKDDYNIISVDWVYGAAPPYTQAVSNARIVGAIVANFMHFLEEKHDISPAEVHLIGHSLGAHVAGYAGERLQGLGRITGLDPAEPYFQYTDPKVRLDPTDAQFVDVIHTDGGSIIIGGLGMIQDCGHVDFYPNGGKRQPGCNNGVIGSIEKEGDLLYGIRRYLGCSHIRAYEFFIESVNTDCPFLGYVCDSYYNFTNGKCSHGCGEDNSLCAHMGYRAHEWRPYAKPEPTKMFLETANFEPFCRYHYHVKITCSDSEEAKKHGKERGRLFIRITGKKGQTRILEASKEHIQYAPGSTIEFIVSAHDLGKLLRLDMEWRSASSLFNPLSWRLFNAPQVYIKEVEITNLEFGIATVFSIRDEAIEPQKIKTIFV
ncbi:inactive pancreatic lipase-related protein 1-like [Centruroides sculpturatus]|uniref:inactive pancreatic lipase-related protein 1-like n=1 Tax=Centruroides sculpturatus TaxID=218467 RepID=UPI000C6CF4CA|nr:inactive pancreatic lipase-related protein 1-like [Centruroides sculpturatus]